MEKLQISTTQNVNIDYQLASVGDRILAYLIDAFIQISAVVLLVLIFQFGFGIQEWWLSLVILPLMFYHLLCEAFLNGQSFGKMVMKIRAIKIDGSELRFVDCALRWLFRLVDFNLPFVGAFVGLLVIIIGGKGQRVGDIVAKTTVLKIDPKGSLNDTAYVEIEEGYTPTYPEVMNLSETDLQTVKEVLNLIQKNNSYNNIGAPHPLALKTKEVVLKKLNIETKLSAKDFLTLILKDYNYYHQ